MIGLGHLRIPSRDFWQMSMREWLYAVEGYKAKMGISNVQDPLDQDELKDLMERYPDNVVDRDTA